MKTQLASTDEARTLVRWLTPLFYLQIAQFVLGYMGKDTVLAVLPWLRYPASVLSALCGAGITVCLWMCAPVLDLYQKAAIFTGLGVFADTVVRFSFGLYLTYTAHAAALDNRDARLAARFRDLWKYTLVTVVAMFLSPFLARASGILALLVLVVSTAGNIGATVCAIVSLRQAIRVFARDGMAR